MPQVNSSLEHHSFSTSFLPFKDTDCVLIFDHERKAYVLEKLESTLSFAPLRGKNGSNKTTPLFDPIPSGTNQMKSDSSPEFAATSDTSPEQIPVTSPPDDDFGLDDILGEVLKEDDFVDTPMATDNDQTPKGLFDDDEEGKANQCSDIFNMNIFR